MNSILRVSATAALAVGMLLVTSAAWAGKQYAVIVGLDYGPANQAWAADALAVKAAIMAVENNNAAITLLQGTPAAPVAPNDVLMAINACANAAVPGDSFLFYYSGHGTYYADANNPDLLGPSLNPCLEALYFNNGGAVPINKLLPEGDLTAALSNFNPAITKLSFLDACFSGGFWNGPGQPGPVLNGSLSTVPNSFLIAAADENSVAPGNSQITANWINEIANINFNLTTMTAAQINQMYTDIVPGNVVPPNIKSPPGFPNPAVVGNDFPYDPTSYDWMPTEVPDHSAYYTNAPEPATLVLALCALAGFVAVARKRGHSRP